MKAMSEKRVETIEADVMTEFDIDVTAEIETNVQTIHQPQTYWLNVEKGAEATSAEYFVRGNEQRSFRGVEVVEATSVVKASSAMQEALVEVTNVMHEYDLPEEVIETVLNALELAKATNVLKYRPRTAK